MGGDNTFGHPSPRLLDRLGDTLVLRTDQHGRVMLSTDGERLWVEVERVRAVDAVVLERFTVGVLTRP